MLLPLCFSCRNRIERNDDSTQELKENEIWNPIIFLSREETKLVRAESEKLYKKENQ